MPRFSASGATFTPDELATFREAYADACRKLGLAHSPSEPEDNKRVRDDLEAAILNAAKLGERDPAALTNYAIAIGMRHWHLR
jgi:hypothetical protein